MMMKNRSIATALIFAGVAFSASASAQTYVGGALSQARWDVDCAGATACDTSDTGYKFFAGYDFNQIIGIEASYFYLGDVTASDGVVKGSFNAKGLEASAVVKTPRLKGFAGFAKLGLAYVHGESGGTVAGISASTSKSSAQPVYGLGITYLIGDNTSVRAEYERRKVKVADMDGSTTTVSTFSIGLQASY
ncbi:MAG: outer membrane beta-barrel protein [Undibacterium sp.]|nr:outer membrane beta-barrel protein [Undibacterium sp.]